MDENVELDYEFTDSEGSSGTSSPTHADSVAQAMPSNSMVDITPKSLALENGSDTCLSYVPCAASNLTNNKHIFEKNSPQKTLFFHEPIKKTKGSSESGRKASYEGDKFKENEHQSMTSSASAQNALVESTSIVNNHPPSSVPLPHSSYGNSFLSNSHSLFRPKLSKIVNLNPNSNSCCSTQLEIKIKNTKLCSSERLLAPTQEKRFCDTATVTLSALDQKKGYLGHNSVTQPASMQKKSFIDTTSVALPAQTLTKGPFDTLSCSPLQASDSRSHCHYSAVTEAAADLQMQGHQTSVTTPLENVDPISFSKEFSNKESRPLTLSPNRRGESQIPSSGKVGEDNNRAQWDHREPALKSRKRGRPPKKKEYLTECSFEDARVKLNVVPLPDTVSRVSENTGRATTLAQSTSIVSRSKKQTASSSVVVKESSLTSPRKYSEFNSKKRTMKSEAGYRKLTSFAANLKVSENRPTESTASKELQGVGSSSKWGKLVETEVKGSLELKSSNSTPVKSDDTSAFQCDKWQNKVPDKESLLFPPSLQILPTSAQGRPASLHVTSKSSREAPSPGFRKPGPKSKCTRNNSNLSKVSTLGDSEAADSEALKIQKRFLGIQMAIENVARMASIDDVDFTKALPAKKKYLGHTFRGTNSSTKQCSSLTGLASPCKVVKPSERHSPAATFCKRYKNAQTIQKKYVKEPFLNRAFSLFNSPSSSLQISNPTINGPMDSLQTQTGGRQSGLSVMEQRQQLAVKTTDQQPTEVGKFHKAQFQDTQSSACCRSVQQHRGDIEMYQAQSRFPISESRQLQTTTAQAGTNASYSGCVHQSQSVASVNTSLLNPASTIIHQDQVHLIPETLPRLCLPSNIEQGHQLRLPNNCALYFQFRSRVDYLLPPVYVKHTNMMEKLSADPQLCDPANFPFRPVHVFMFYQPSDIALPFMTLIPYYSLNDCSDFHRLKMENQTLHLIVNTDVVRRNRFPNGETVLVLENPYNIMLVYGVPRYQLNPLSSCSFITNPTVDEAYHTSDEVSPSIKAFRFVKVTTDSFVIDSRILSTTLNCRKITLSAGAGNPYQNAALQPTVNIGPNLAQGSCTEGLCDVPRESKKPATHAAEDVYSRTDSFEGFDNTTSPSKNILNRLSDQVPVSLNVGSSKLDQSVEIMFTDDEEDVTLVRVLKKSQLVDGVLRSGASLPPTGKKEVKHFVRPCPARHKSKSVHTEEESPRKLGNDASKTFLDHPRVGMCATDTPASPFSSSKKMKDPITAAKLPPSKLPNSLEAPSSERLGSVKKEAPLRSNSKVNRLHPLFSGKTKPKIPKHRQSQNCGATDMNNLEIKGVRKNNVKPKERFSERQCPSDSKQIPIKDPPSMKKTTEPELTLHYTPKRSSPTTRLCEPSKKKTTKPNLEYQCTPERISPMTMTRHSEKRRILTPKTSDPSKPKPIVISVDSPGEPSQLVRAIAPVDEQQVQPQQKQQLALEEPVLLNKRGQENHDLAQPSTFSILNGQVSVQTTVCHQTPPVMTNTLVTSTVACPTLKSHTNPSFMKLPSVAPSAVQINPPFMFLQQPCQLLQNREPKSPLPPPKQLAVATNPCAATRILPRLLPKPPSALELHALPRQLTPSKKKLQVLGGLYNPEVYQHEGHYYRLASSASSAYKSEVHKHGHSFMLERRVLKGSSNPVYQKRGHSRLVWSA